MHEMTQSDEYVKCLHVAAALHFYHYVDVVYAIKKHVILSLSSVEAKVFFRSFFLTNVSNVCREERTSSKTCQSLYTDLLYRAIFNLAARFVGARVSVLSR